MHPAQTRPPSPLSRGCRRLQAAEEQLWGTPHRPGMGTCPRGRFQALPRVAGCVCAGERLPQGRRGANALTERRKAGLRTDLAKGPSPLLARKQ